MSNCILRSLSHPCVDHYAKAFVVYCRPILEYCSQVWSPYKLKDVDRVENAQRSYTRLAFRKIFPGPYSPCYSTRLKIFGLKSLEYRRLELDLIMCYKIVRGFSDITFETMFTFMGERSRRGGHRYQLARRSCTANVVLHSFSFRVVRVWNKLPADVVEAKNVADIQKSFESFGTSRYY